MNDEIDLEELAPWLALLITLLGGLLRVLLLGMKGMWLDETFSVWLANQSIPEMLQWIVRIDQHPPLYYLLLHSWLSRYGDAPFDARMLSVLFGTATIPILYLTGKRLFGVVVGLAAAALLALSPFHIYFAQETRMYTLLAFTAAAAMYALVRLLTDPRSLQPIGRQFREYPSAWRTAATVAPGFEIERGFSYKQESGARGRWRAWVQRHGSLHLQAIETDLAWVAFIVFTAAALLTHNTAVLFLFAVNLFFLGMVFFQRRKKSASLPAFQAHSLGNWAKAQAGILLLWSPWIIFFFKQARMVYKHFWVPAPTWESVLEVLKAFLNASAPVTGIPGMLVWILYGSVLGFGLVYFWRSRKVSQFLFLAVLFAAPFLGELLVSLWRPIFLARTLIWITLPLFLLLAAGIAQLRLRFLMLAALGCLGAINLFSAGDYYKFFQKEDWGTAAGYVALFSEENDLVLFNSNFVEIPFNYYFETYEEGYSVRVEKQGVPLDLFKDGVLEPEMTTGDIPGLIALLHGHDRVWLVYSHDSYTDPLGLIPQTLAAHRKLLRTHDFVGGQVQLYGSP